MIGHSRPLVTVAVLREMPEGGGHLLQLPRLPLEDVDVLKGDPLHVRAGAIPIPPQGDEFRDLLDGEAEVAGPPDEAEGVDVVVRVHPVPGFGPDGLRDQSDGLVVMFFSLTAKVMTVQVPSDKQGSGLARNDLL